MIPRRCVRLAVMAVLLLCFGAQLGAAERAPAPDRQPSVQGFEKVSSPVPITIMLVDDDWDYSSTLGGGRPYYTTALDALGESYVVWDTVSQGAPTAADMAPYAVVIWFTGYDWDAPIEPADETQLQAYLDGGGNLILSSLDYHYSAGTVTPFMQNYLGVGAVVDDVNQLDPVGHAGDPVGNGLGPYAMVRPDAWGVYWPTGSAEGPYDDLIDPATGAFSPFNYQAMAVSASTRYSEGSFRTIFLGWPFEWIGPLADRQEILGAMIDWTTGQAAIMLVDDDWNFTSALGGGRPYYTSTLDGLGDSYVVWDTVSLGAPTAADMAPYQLVIWFTGYDWETPIEPTDETQLQAYLDGGGNLILSSQEYHYYAGTVTPFMQNYLGVGAVLDDVIQLDPVGNAGDPVGNGLGPYAMVRPDAWEVYWPTGSYEGPYDDQVGPKVGAFSPFNYQVTAVSASTRYSEGSFRTIFLGWPFEWIGPLAERQEILGAMIDWTLTAALPFSDGFESGDTSAWSATVP